MEGKTVAESSFVLSKVMTQQHTNPAGNVHGGIIAKLIDDACGVVSYRHARSNVVTASIDRIDFFGPVYVGDVLTVKASLNYVGRTSMEIGARVEAESLVTGEIRHTASAYLTSVALDEQGSPKQIPPVLLQTEEEIRRHQEAEARRVKRLAERKMQHI